MTVPSSAYVDSSGRPRLRQSFVGFLDLLGFSQRVTSASPSGDSQQLLDLITSSISDSRGFVRQIMTEDSAENPIGWSVLPPLGITSYRKSAGCVAIKTCFAIGIATILAMTMGPAFTAMTTDLPLFDWATHA